MRIGPTEIFIVFIMVVRYAAIPALLVFVAYLFYRFFYLKLKTIEARLRSLEEKMSGTPKI